MPIAIGAAVIAIKRPGWTPAVTLLIVLMAVVALAMCWMSIADSRRNSDRKRSLAAIGFLWLAWLGALWESYAICRANKRSDFDATRPIVCVGDSLTTGLGSNEAYPEYLQQLVRAPIVNFGRAGVTARDMTKHLHEILECKPQVVVIELGGHDFLRGYGRNSTRESLAKIIAACENAGADVILFEIPRGFVTDPFSGLERELAREYDLELIPDSAIRMLVVRSPAIPFVGNWTKPHRSDDGLHPNKLGAKSLASEVFRTLSRMYGPTIQATASKGHGPRE